MQLVYSCVSLVKHNLDELVSIFLRKENVAEMVYEKRSRLAHGVTLCNCHLNY